MINKEWFRSTYSVTETCQNGNERTFKKDVYSPRFINGKFNCDEQRIEAEKKALRELHYYNIYYLGTSAVTFIIGDYEEREEKRI